MTQNRIQAIVKHLVGTALPMSSALSESELDNAVLIEELRAAIYRDACTKKWCVR